MSDNILYTSYTSISFEADSNIPMIYHQDDDCVVETELTDDEQLSEMMKFIC